MIDETVTKSYYFSDCPAEVYIEIKGCGETYIPHSPNLQTCGLQMINIFFAKGLATKVKYQRNFSQQDESKVVDC